MSDQNNNQRNILIACGGCLLMLLCFCGVFTVFGTSLAIFASTTETAQNPTVTPFVVARPATVTPLPPPTSEGGGATVVPDLVEEMPATTTPLPLPVPDVINSDPIPADAYASLNALRQADFPIHDYHDSAKRLDSTDPGERTVNSRIWNIGDVQTFTTDGDPVQATLMAVGEYSYFWVDNDITNFSNAEVEEAMAKLEGEYLPLLQRQFGDFWQPGVDNDPRFSVLHLESFVEGTEIGFFDSSDEYPNSINESSNEQEIIYLNMDYLDLGEELYFGTLVHEIEHLIQWHTDGNETTWMDEGLAQVAETMLNLDSVDTYDDWLNDPQIQFNVWEYEDEDLTFAHYGGAYLFMLYFWEQLGDEAIAAVSRHPGNGLQAVEAVLAQYRPDLPLQQFVADWAVAIYLDGENAGKQYDIQNLRLTSPDYANEIRRLPSEETATLSQFGVHYIDIREGGAMHIQFAGDTIVPLIGSRPPSGDTAWLAPSIDNLQAQLSADFDLTGVNNATLEFKAWYDLEEDWDFVYVTVSDDGGATWTLLRPDNSSPGQYGPAFGGLSADVSDNKGGWVNETISLSRYAGKNITIRFEALTDTAIRERGFAIDDIAIPEIGYSSDVEGDTSEWTATGFVATGWQLPQQWSVQLIHDDSNTVTPIPLNEYNQADIMVELGGRGGTLVIIPLTQFVTQDADYWLRVE